MAYLPVNSSIVVAGGRNDSLCKENATPLLNDIFLFLLDQKVWIRLKFSYNSDKMEYINNHTMGVITDNEGFEKIIIFGGIQNQIRAAPDSKDSKDPMHNTNTGNADPMDAGNVLSFLSNKCYLVTV